eukprot:gene15482-6733_t
MAGEEETEEERQAKMYRRNTKRLRRNLLERFLMAMKEDLAEWLSSLTDIDMNAINFMNKLDNGVLLCEHANLVQKHAEEYISKLDVENKIKIPTCRVYYREKGAFKGSFIARDNVANFISWCKDLGIPDVVLFETEDLVLHKNEKTVVLTLLDVARKAAKFGVKPPQLVELEEEIDREIEEDKKDSIKNKNRVEKVLELEEENDLDQLVHDVVDTCTCSSQFPVKKLGDGKYKFGNNKQLIFVRVMRNHVMVRVGGGWDTLEHYIDKHDPCRLHVAGKVNRQGRAEKIPARKLSAMMEVNSDEASVCSSESFGSGDGRIFSSISPDSDLSSELSLSACSSHRSSMHQDSDDETCTIQTSRSEPLSTRHPKDDNDLAIRETKSETFTKFSNRKLSLMDYNLKDSDIYLTRNPGDSWLRKQLNERKLSTHTKEQTEKVPGDPEPTGKENMTVESIKKKYGRPVKQRSQKRDGTSTPKSRRRTVTNPNPAKQEEHEKMPRLQPRNHPQYRSWDQTVVAVKRRKDTVKELPNQITPLDANNNDNCYRKLLRDTKSENRISSKNTVAMN